MQKKYLSIAFIFISLSIFLILVQISGIKIIYHFFRLSNWKTDDPNIKISLENPDQILIEGTSENKEITVIYHFDQPVKLDLINRDALLVRMRLTPQITNLKLRLISNHDFRQYAEWETGYESSRFGVDGSRLMEWQNYHLPIIWGKNINFDHTSVTDLVIIYYPSSLIDGYHLKISSPVIKSRFYLPWPIFFNDPRAKSINTSNINKTKLPVFYLNIPTESLAKLNSDFPQNVRQNVPAELTTPDGQKFKVAIQNRGDRENHYSYFKRSWRITFSGNDNYQDLKRLNFIIPEEIFYGTILPYQISEKIGLISPAVFSARLEINGIDYGAYPVVEQVDSILLAKYQKIKGFLYYGDCGLGEKFDPENFLFESPLYWKLYEKINWEPENGDDPLAKLLKIISLPQSQFEHQIESILDVENYLKWYALYQLFNSAHNDEFHNIKMFYSADSGKFEMIPWDIVPNLNPQFLNLESSKNFVNNRLTFKILQVSKYLIKLDELYYQYGKETFLSPSFNQAVDRIVNETKNDYLNDIFIFPVHKKNYENDLKLWKERITSHVIKIISEIEEPEFQICRLNDNNIILSAPAIFVEEKKNRLLVPKITVQPVNNWLVEQGSMHREQLTYEPTKHILPVSSIIINPITKQAVYQPEDFSSLEKCK